MGAVACPGCGQLAPDSSLYCPHCGHKLAPAPPPTQTYIPAPPPYGSVPPQYAAPIDPYAPQKATYFPLYPVPTVKFVLLCLCTFSLYIIFWSYQNWKRISQMTGEKLSPFWRAVFSPIWCYSLFRRMQELCRRQGTPANWIPGLLAALFIIFNVCWRLPDPWSAISFLTFTPFIPVVVSAAAFNHALAPQVQEDLNERFKGWEIAVLIIGGILLILAMIGIFMPPAATTQAPAPIVNSF